MRDARAQVADLYARHAASVYRRARALLDDEAEANEVLQDVFVSLIERPQQFAGRSQVSTFLYSVTTHLCLNRLRNQRTRARLLQERGAPVSQPQAEPDQMTRVRETLRLLPEPLAEVAVYYYVDELDQQEIAEILGCSRQRVGRLLERLQEWGRAQEAACSAE
jgi:RNA polymerase sigma-70 factor (ECF subfamily)